MGDGVVLTFALLCTHKRASLKSTCLIPVLGYVSPTTTKQAALPPLYTIGKINDTVTTVSLTHSNSVGEQSSNYVD